MRHWLLITFVLCGALRAEAGPLTLNNGSFENGMAGWNAIVPTYLTPYHDGWYPAGTTQTLGGFRPLLPEAQSSFDGVVMALIGSQDTGGAGFSEPVLDIQLQQTIALDAGAFLSGQAFFYNGDYIQQDRAWVRILNAAGDVVATPWMEWSGEPAFEQPGQPIKTGFQTSSPWTTWSWQPHEAGSYTIALGVSTAGDNRYASYAGFDAVRVPEPSIALLLLISVGAIGLGQRRL